VYTRTHSSRSCHRPQKSFDSLLAGGAAVSCLGHGDLEEVAAVQAQIGKLAFAHTGFFTSEPTEMLADLLIDHAPGKLNRVFLCRVVQRLPKWRSSWYASILLKKVKHSV